MSVAELKKYILKSKYARHNKAAKRRETYDEAVNRIREMMHTKYESVPDVHPLIDWAYDEVLKETALGSQRAMQYGGDPILSKNSRLYNCTSSYANRLRFFQEAFWLLLCGCGVGFSVQTHHVASLPEFSGAEVDRVRLSFRGVDPVDPITFVVPDTIEGWADSLGVLLSCYFEGGPFPEYYGRHVRFDLGRIRPKGSPLSSGAGRAPGPEPLRTALHKIRSLIDDCIRRGQTRLRPIDVYDVIMYASDAVLAGGVRRSATICVFSPDDEEMAKAKTGDWLTHNRQRARSNNSALLVRSDTSFEQFAALMEHTRSQGEPGFLWSDSTELLPNPCFHPDTLLATERGLISIGELAADGNPVRVSSDDRVLKGDQFDEQSHGVSLHNATPVVLTQRNAPIFAVETTHGHLIKVTSNHEFPTQRGRLPLSQMEEGDMIFLPSGVGYFGDEGSFSDGALLGLITGDGYVCNREAFVDVWEKDFDSLDQIQAFVNGVAVDLPSSGSFLSRNRDFQWQSGPVALKSRRKRIGGRRVYRHLAERLNISDPLSIKSRAPSCVLRGSCDMVRGYLQGLFFADGTIGCPRGKRSFSLRLDQSNIDLLRDVQTLLSQFGIISSIYRTRPACMRLMPDGRGGMKEYHCRETYVLVMNKSNTCRFLREVGLFGRKHSILLAAIAERGHAKLRVERYTTHIKSITPCDVSDVYCLTQFDTNAVVANGCVTGQCVEIGFWAKLRLDRPDTADILKGYDGPIGYDSSDMVPNASGFSFCNLSTINGSKVSTSEDFYKACRVAAILGTLQAGFTGFDYLGRVTEEIVRREALLGVSITSIMSNPKVMLDPKVLRRGAEIVLRTNAEVAEIIGINPCARGTCIKPEGTSTLMLGSLASGCHGWPFSKGVRNVQANCDEIVYRWFRQYNPQACARSVWCEDGATDFISFPIEAPPGALLQGDMTAVEFLDVVKTLYLNWVVPGKRAERCTQPWLNHNVSNTVKVKTHEWDDVTRHIYDNRSYYAGIALLPWSGDRDYEQAPHVAVHDLDEMRRTYGVSAVTTVRPTYERIMSAYDGKLWEACRDFESGKIPDNAERAMAYGVADWFANNHLDGDRKRLSYLLKDLYYLDQYEMLGRTFVPVPYEDLIEEEDATTPEAEPACAGGACIL